MINDGSFLEDWEFCRKRFLDDLVIYAVLEIVYNMISFGRGTVSSSTSREFDNNYYCIIVMFYVYIFLITQKLFYLNICVLNLFDRF